MKRCHQSSGTRGIVHDFGRSDVPIQQHAPWCQDVKCHDMLCTGPEERAVFVRGIHVALIVSNRGRVPCHLNIQYPGLSVCITTSPGGERMRHADLSVT